MSFTDKVINKVTGRNMETVQMSLEQMVSLIDKIFISQASTSEEYDAIYKTVKGGLIFSKELDSKNKKCQMNCTNGRRVSIFNMKDRNYIWIHDIEKDTFFEYRAWSFRKFKILVKETIANEKAKFR
jgi:hypothetical protein